MNSSAINFNNTITPPRASLDDKGTPSSPRKHI